MNHPIVYPTLGLANEAGEVAGKVKKIFRDRGGVLTDADREALTLNWATSSGTCRSCARNSASGSRTSPKRTSPSCGTGPNEGSWVARATAARSTPPSRRVEDALVALRER
jgi:hypothetical protein